MITSPEPKEYAQQSVLVASGAGSTIVNLSGYLDAILWDVPTNETYKFSIKGPAGGEYYLTPQAIQGDSTVIFSPAIPMTGKMTLSIIGASGNGLFLFTPVGNLK